jgi:preprotein translocase subunit SecE
MKNRTATAKRTVTRPNFFGETVNELKKVVWLSWQDTLRLTGLVLLVTIVVGIILGVIDFGFSKIVDAFLLGT